MPSVSEATEAAQPPPAKRGRNAALISPQSHKLSEKKAKSGLTFSRHGDKLFFGNGYHPSGIRFRAHSIGYFSKKSSVNPPSFNLSFLPKKRNIPAKDLRVFVFCWAFLLRFLGRFLAGPTDVRMGIRPAFFVFGRCLVRRNLNSPEPTMLPFEHRAKNHLSIVGKILFRQVSTIFCKRILSIYFTQLFIRKEFNYANY